MGVLVQQGQEQGIQPVIMGGGHSGPYSAGVIAVSGLIQVLEEWAGGSEHVVRCAQQLCVLQNHLNHMLITVVSGAYGWRVV